MVSLSQRTSEFEASESSAVGCAVSGQSQTIQPHRRDGNKPFTGARVLSDFAAFRLNLIRNDSQSEIQFQHFSKAFHFASSHRACGAAEKQKESFH